MCVKIVKKVFKAVLDRKRPFLHYQNIIMVLDKNVTFLYLFFFSQIGRAKVFREVLNKKLPFLDHKNINIKDRKIRIFPKGLVHGF